MNAAFTSFLRDWRVGASGAMKQDMNGNRKSGARGGGAIIAGAIIAGVIAGIAAGQPSIGFLAGAGAGVLIALLLWLRDRRIQR